MPVDYQSFLTTEDFSGYEDKDLYEKEYLPKVEKYRADLESALKPEYKTELPKDFSSLTETGFNPLKYFYENKLLSDRELLITDTPAFKLRDQLAKGDITAVEVFKAFAHRAVIGHQLTNGAQDFFIDEGLQRAEFLDKYLQENGKPIGPLHGIPISLKEQMNFKGRITHGSYVSKISNVPEKHGVTNQVLEKLGAVFYVRTAQPQTLMHLDSNNNITGVARNPHNTLLSPGGSSSGEGALGAFGASAIGVGSDIGGSIRGPAAFSGSIGFRPTTRRISTFGGISGGAGQESVPAVVGPMGRSVEDMELWMKAYINEGKPWELDQWCIPLPWKEVAKPKPEELTIAILYDDELVQPTPPIQRGLKETVKKLEAAGVKIVEFKAPNTKLAYEAVHKMYSCDGNYMQKKLLSDSGEPLTKLTKWSLNFGEGSKNITNKETRELNLTRDSLRQEYTDYLLKNKVDFIIAPVYNNVAPKIENIYNWSYTSLFNILDFPSLTLQTGLYQDPSVDTWDEEHKSRKFRSPLEELEHQQYDPEVFKGAPIAFQLAGRRYFDEDVIAAGKTIVDILGVDLYKQYQ